MLVAVDSNFLIHCYRLRIPVLSELERLVPDYELVTCDKIVSELEKLAKRPSLTGLGAQFALRVLEKAKVEHTELLPDDWLLNFAREKKAIVCTNDGELRRKLLRLGIRVITIKHKSHLDFA